MERFKRTQDPHGIFETCQQCGETLIFTANARPETIEAEKAAHQCRKAQGAAIAQADYQAA